MLYVQQLSQKYAGFNWMEDKQHKFGGSLPLLMLPSITGDPDHQSSVISMRSVQEESKQMFCEMI